MKERFKILFGGNVWLGVLSGKTQPPVFVAGERVFEKTPFKAQIKAFLVGVKEDVIEWVESLKKDIKQPDKKKHFIVGFLITLLLGGLVNHWLGIDVAIIVAFAKEWYDSKGHGVVERKDIAFTIYGALCAFPLAWLLNVLI